MHIAEYNLDYVRSLLSVGGWQGTDEDLKNILQKANNKASVDLFDANLISAFYTTPKQVHESIHFVTRKGGTFDELIHLNFIKKIQKIFNDFLPECTFAECSFSSGYTTLDMSNDKKSLQISIIYNETVKVHTSENLKNTIQSFSLKD